MKTIGIFLLLLLAQPAVAATLLIEELPPLPQASSNNAVSAFRDNQGLHLISLLGLGSQKTPTAIHKQGFISSQGKWQKISVPGQPRLASAAANIGNSIYLLGGYTVADDGSEVSTPEVYRYQDGKWQTLRPMPVPVDDMVVLVYQQRYIYLVSGWHDVGNVNLVQVLDTRTGEWQQATPWPGEPVFGHAGAIFEDRMVVCDGVRIQYPQLNLGTEKKREFLSSPQCWLGEINKDDIRRINWQRLANHPGDARYRMVAAATDTGLLVFAGGSTNPYNYDGVGYNNKASVAEAEVFSYDLKADRWQVLGSLPQASMDHRGMIYDQGWFYLLGGMTNPQTVTDRVLRFKLD
ncbi:MAG: galactose oxidase [Proteobacteria bacterium]|nr:galactose oxidase [Pseudomonadota bacterium]